jgi:hypothetical protein
MSSSAYLSYRPIPVTFSYSKSRILKPFSNKGKPDWRDSQRHRARELQGRNNQMHKSFREKSD